MVGPFGAGKSTIGAALSKKLHYDFIDLDREIEEQSGVELDWIVDKEGIEGYRRREHELLQELIAFKTPTVISTGGGTVLDKNNRQFIRQGFVIYLKVELSAQQQRTKKRQEKRPILQQQSLTKTNLEREPFYREVADITLFTDKASLNKIITDILLHRQNFGTEDGLFQR